MLIAYPIPAFYRQIDEPADALTGALWFNTSTNILKVLNSSSDWVNVAEEQDLILKLIGQNALNILDLTAQASLTAGINGNFERDIYIKTNGLLETIDLINTTAKNGGSKYFNFSSINYSYLTNQGSSGIPNVNYYNVIFNCKKDLSINTIVLNSETTATKLQVLECLGAENYRVISNIYEINIKTFQNLNLSLKAGKKYCFKLFSDTGNISLKNAQTPLNHIAINFEGSSQMGIIGIDFDYIDETSVPTDKVVQTNPQTIDAGFTKFMIIANEETSGTGSVTYDITFDGTNYQEDLESFIEYEINNPGTSMILKQNLNAGVSSGTASAYNWGVLLW